MVEALRGLSPEFAPADDDGKGTEPLDTHRAALFAAGARGEVSGGGARDATLTVAAYTDPKRRWPGCSAATSDFPKLGRERPLTGDPTSVAVALEGDTATLNLFVTGPTIAAAARKVVAGLLTEIE